MKGIGEFFGRMQGKFAQEIAVRAVIQEIIKKQTTLEVPLDKITFVGMDMVLKNLDQTAKSAVFIKKASLLKEIAAIVSKKSITNIRFV